jgi:hypothetical protein
LVGHRHLFVVENQRIAANGDDSERAFHGVLRGWFIK